MLVLLVEIEKFIWRTSDRQEEVDEDALQDLPQLLGVKLNL
ncbi:MAG: hypothetical protein UW09_C0004G0111 [candidate division TM6 bacterium GW2011_GWF2_43_87]|nr:MAG: hypothetical protein UW09_C0004G0111 [candidate division TM6 bacterium GW2011_GWF2_43_87]